MILCGFTLTESESPTSFCRAKIIIKNNHIRANLTFTCSDNCLQDQTDKNEMKMSCSFLPSRVILNFLTKALGVRPVYIRPPHEVRLPSTSQYSSGAAVQRKTHKR